MDTVNITGADVLKVSHVPKTAAEDRSDVKHRLTVGAFNWMIPHYRQSLFSLLSKHPTIEFTFCAPIRYHDPTIRIGDVRQLRYKEIRSWQWKIPFMPQYVTVQLHSIRAIIRNEYDVLILLNDIAGVDVWICLVLARMLGRRVVLWGQALSKSPSRMRIFMRRIMSDLADALLVYTDRGKEFWTREGVDPAKIFVAYNALDTKRIDEVRQSLAQRDLLEYRNRRQWGDKKIIVVDGRLVPEKRIDIVLQAMKRVVERHSNTHLVIIGDGPMKQEIHRLMEVNDIPHMVTLLGAVYDERELGLVYRNAVASMLPAFAGLAIMHAFSYGVPFIIGRGKSTDHGPEADLVIHNENGFVCDLDSVDEFADAICMLLENDALQKSMSDHAFRIIHEKYNLDNMAAGIVEAVRYCAQL